MTNEKVDEIRTIILYALFSYKLNGAIMSDKLKEQATKLYLGILPNQGNAPNIMKAMVDTATAQIITTIED